MPGGGELSEQRALTKGADDDQIGGGGGVVFDGGCFTGNAGDVLGEVVGGAEDGGRIIRFDQQRGGGLTAGEQPGIRGGRVAEIHGQAGGRSGQRHEDEQGNRVQAGGETGYIHGVI